MRQASGFVPAAGIALVCARPTLNASVVARNCGDVTPADVADALPNNRSEGPCAHEHRGPPR